MVETKKMPQQVQKKMFSISLAKKNCKSVGKIAYSVMSFCSLSLCSMWSSRLHHGRRGKACTCFPKTMGKTQTDK